MKGFSAAVSKEADMSDIALKITTFLVNYPVVLLEGDLGAGKTTFTKYLLKALGSIDDVSSPTFTIVNHYLTGSSEDVFHFDCYRLEDEEEALEIGFEEYLEQGKVCIIEWPNRIPNLIPDSGVLKININILDDLSTRSIAVVPV